MERFEETIDFRKILDKAGSSLSVQEKNGAGPVMYPASQDLQPASLGKIHGYAETYLSRLAESLGKEYKEPQREPRRDVCLRSDKVIYMY